MIISFPSAHHSSYRIESQKLQYDDLFVVSQALIQKKITFEEAVLVVKHSLTDYSDSAGELASLSYFVSKTTNQNLKDFVIKEVTGKGSSSNKVYRVLDKKTKEVLYVIKTFKENSCNFFSEIFALQFIKKAEIENFAVPKIQDVGQYCIENKRSFLLCESAAPGQTLDRFYKETLLKALDPLEHEKNLNALLKATHACGKSLACLHQHFKAEKQAFAANFEERVRGYLGLTVQRLSINPYPGVDTNKLQDVFEDMLIDLKSDLLPATIIHGDTKLSNGSWDSNSHTVTWFDLSTLPNSLDATDKRIGWAVKDIHSFIEDIRDQQVDYYLDEQQTVCKRTLLTENEIQELIHKFEEGYTEAGGELPTEKQLEFFRLASGLYFIGTDRSQQSGYFLAEPYLSQKKERIERNFEKLVILLSKRLN